MSNATCHKAHVFGDHIDTDVIIPARYLNRSEPDYLAAHCMIDIDSTFAQRVSRGDVMVAGTNFGCGSSREHAPIAIKAAGIHCVIAKSFARIFHRNAINIGLSLIEADTTALQVKNGDAIKINWELGVLVNKTSGIQIPFDAPPPFISQIIAAGGLLSYVQQEQEAMKKDVV